MTFIGHTTTGPYYLSDQDRARHLYIIGQTGSGKSTLLANLIAGDIWRGKGIGVADPHGALIEDILRLIPRERMHDVFYVNPADLECPIAYNVLEHVHKDARARVADGVVAAFRHVWSDSWGPRMENIMLHCIRALLDTPGSTLLGVPRMLRDEAYRHAIVAQAEDPVTVSFWTNDFESWDDRYRKDAIAPVLNKFDRLLSSPAVRNIIAQPTSTLDLRFTMDDRRILLLNLNKGQLGEGNARLLGALFMTGIANAALSRGDASPEERPPFYLYCDEFQNFATESFGLILSEARKYGLSLTLAHQFLGQLPESLQLAVMGNAGSTIALRVGAEDAPLIARHLGWDMPGGWEAEMKSVPNFYAWGRFLEDGYPTNPTFLKLPQPPEIVSEDPTFIINASRAKFGRARAQVEKKIASFMDY
jgi:GTPase SAR1 family protein